MKQRMSEAKETIKEAPVKEAPATPAKKAAQSSAKIAVILVRGLINTRTSVKTTLAMLGLKRKNSCVMIPDNPSYRGMLNKVKDMVTWGPIDDSTIKMLIDKRSKNATSKNTASKNTASKNTASKNTASKNTASKNNTKEDNPTYHLNPPRKGFGRKGIKKSFSIGGGLGDRKEKINDLILRMI